MEQPKDLEKLIDPFKVPKFTLHENGNTWEFPGATISRKVYEKESCIFNGTKTYAAISGNLLTLPEYAAVMTLAINAFQGNDLSKINSISINGAKELFYSALHLSLTTSNPKTSEHQHFFGEPLYDIIKIKNRKANNNQIEVEWYQKPECKEDGSWTKGTLTTVIQTSIPNNTGLGIKTEKGYLNPETGLPFETETYNPLKANKFITEIVEAAKRKRGIHTQEQIFLGNILNPHATQFLRKFDLYELEDELGELIQFWRPSYQFSHNFDKETLLQYSSSGELLTMNGVDERSTFFAPTLGYNGAHCGIQPRAIRRVKPKENS